MNALSQYEAAKASALQQYRAEQAAALVRYTQACDEAATAYRAARRMEGKRAQPTGTPVRGNPVLRIRDE